MAKSGVTGSSKQHMGFASSFEDIHQFVLRSSNLSLSLLLLPAPESCEEEADTQFPPRTARRFVDTCEAQDIHKVKETRVTPSPQLPALTSLLSDCRRGERGGRDIRNVTFYHQRQDCSTGKLGSITPAPKPPSVPPLPPRAS